MLQRLLHGILEPGLLRCDVDVAWRHRVKTVHVLLLQRSKHRSAVIFPPIISSQEKEILGLSRLYPLLASNNETNKITNKYLHYCTLHCTRQRRSQVESWQTRISKICECGVFHPHAVGVSFVRLFNGVSRRPT